MANERKPAGMVEAWVQRVVDGMQGTMKAIIKRAARQVSELSLITVRI